MTVQHQSDTAIQTTEWGPRKIPYVLSFQSARSKLAITVHPDLVVTVIAPEGRSLDEIAEGVRRRAGWVAKQLRQFERWHPLPRMPRFVPGESHLYLGRQYRLRLERGPAAVALSSGRLIVRTPSEPMPSAVGDALAVWYAARARETFVRRLKRIQDSIPRLRRIEVRLRIRGMSRRWGSCGPRGTVTLNTALVQAPPSCIDYVLVHELCHRLMPNHSSRFFRLLSSCLPDWERRRERLNSLRA